MRSETSWPWNDLANLPRVLRQGWNDHRAAGLPARDFPVQTTWKPGPASAALGPVLVSFTQYTPKRFTDIPSIWRVADRLGNELTQLDGAVGVVTYLQPARRSVGSLSVWTDEDALATFMWLPYHVEIMSKYRPRGLPVRSATWWSDDFAAASSLAAGVRATYANPRSADLTSAPSHKGNT